MVLVLALDIVMAYPAAAAVEVSPRGIESFKPITSQYYEVEFNLTLENPTNDNIQVEKLTYNLYIEFQYISHGEKTSFLLSPGESNYVFIVGINIDELPAKIRDQLLESEVTIKVTGLVVLPLKIIDTIKIGEITEGYNFLWDVSAGKVT